VPKLDRLARSVPDTRWIGDTLASRGVRLSIGGQVYDPNDPMGKMFFNILATSPLVSTQSPRELLLPRTTLGSVKLRS